MRTKSKKKNKKPKQQQQQQQQTNKQTNNAKQILQDASATVGRNTIMRVCITLCKQHHEVGRLSASI